LVSTRAAWYSPAWSSAGAIDDHLSDFTAAERDLTDAALTAETGHDDWLVARARSRLAFVVSVREDRAADGQKLLREAEAAVARVGHDLQLEAYLLEVQSGVAEAADRYDDAIALDEKQIALLSSRQPIDPLQLGRAENDLATIYFNGSHFDKALPHIERALALEVPVLGEHHPWVLNARYNYAAAVAGTRPKAEGLAAAERLVHDAELLPENVLFAQILDLYARALVAIPTRRAEAPKQMLRSIAVAEKFLAPGNEMLDMHYAELGEVLLLCSRYAEALPLFDRFVAAEEKRPDLSGNGRREGLALRARALLGLGRAKAARTDLERAIALRSKAGDIDPRSLAIEDFALARALYETDEPARGRTLARSAEASFLAHPADDDEDLAAVRAWLRAH
jgi:tetratricopeptide (TPR) repeat protein